MNIKEEYKKSIKEEYCKTEVKMEIERKYQVRYIPGNLKDYALKEIEQGYLCNNPTVRIRKSNDDFYLTYKSKINSIGQNKNNAIINNEVELPLTEEAYFKLKQKIDNNLVLKSRYIIPLQNNLIAELDIFHGLLEGLRMVEVEFPDEEAADSFIPPEWFGTELSSDKSYTNHNLSKLTSINELII